ncbi:MAG: acyl-CoA synthetase FdrA [Candidatus Bipolaricaulota bacterium]
MKRVLIERGRYFDSVFLLRASRTLESLDGVRHAVVAMATPANLESLARIGFEVPPGVRPDDLTVAIDADAASLDAAEQRLATFLAEGSEPVKSGRNQPATLEDALSVDPEVRLALVSVPGVYAAAEARRALRRGLHVLLFSDNVSIDDEISLKDEAARRGLLLMGPDCGTAIVNGLPLGFANVVRRGSIGIVGASGTGIQEVSSLIDRLGGGVSQALGTGGRDLTKAVGARSTLAALDALAADRETAVLVVISKSPAPETEGRVLERLAQSGKPAVVHFVGQGARSPDGQVRFADTLAETARAACRCIGIHAPDCPGGRPPQRALEAPDGRLCGLFCGGTLAQEAWVILRRSGVETHSNVAADQALRLRPDQTPPGHVVWDLGDDVFTVGRPHPMIEPALRDERVAQAVNAERTSIVLVDCVLGYGAHADPAASLARAAGSARRAVVIASVTGTDRDPQRYREQRQRLEEVGILVAESNAEAAQWTAAALRGRRERCR